MRRRQDDPVLITEAPPPYEEEHAARKRKYLVVMGLRLPFFVLAGVFHDIGWLALGFVGLSIPLPWMAVLLANDRPPRKAEKVSHYRRPARTVDPRERPGIDA